MILKKQGFPEEGELVLCTVTSVQSHSVFVRLEEYFENGQNKGGLVHISEISPGRIRNIRDFVTEGKTIVCKVIRINKEKGYIDLSLRRVTEAQRRQKSDSIKSEQKAEKIVEIVCKQHKKNMNEVMDLLKPKSADYETLYAFFEACVKDEKLMDAVGLDKKISDSLMETLRQRIKPEIISISGKLNVKTYLPDGIELIKKVLIKARDLDKENVRVLYLGAGKFQIEVKALDYKIAEKTLSKVVDTVTKGMQKNDVVEFERKED
jgi:translation initiation factor 2 subunit 1